MLTVPSVVWAAASDRELDAEFAKCRNLPCMVNPELFDDDDECADEFDMALGCGRCPIMYACRERTLREETASGDVWGVRGGLTAAQRRHLIERRTSAAGPGRAGGPTFLPPTMTTQQVTAFLAKHHGYEIKSGTWRAKAHKGTAPAAISNGPDRYGMHWDTRDIINFGRTTAGDPVLAPGVTCVKGEHVGSGPDTGILRRKTHKPRARRAGQTGGLKVTANV